MKSSFAAVGIIIEMNREHARTGREQRALGDRQVEGQRKRVETRARRERGGVHAPAGVELRHIARRT